MHQARRGAGEGRRRFRQFGDAIRAGLRALVAIPLALAALAWAESPNAPRAEETQSPVTRALDWFARHQTEDGRWSAAGFSDACSGEKCDRGGAQGDDLRSTALVTLCFVGNSETLRAGRSVIVHRKSHEWRDRPRSGGLRPRPLLVLFGLRWRGIGASVPTPGARRFRPGRSRSVEWNRSPRARSLPRHTGALQVL